MKNFCFIAFFMLFSIVGFSQTTDSVETEDLVIEHDTIDGEVYTIVESMPEFVGGQKGLFEYLGANIIYPKGAKEKNIQGKVYVNFTVDTDGSIKDVKIIRGAHPLLDEEAMRLISTMPKWKPGTQRGRTVKVSYNLPITFKLGIQNLPPLSEAEKLFDEGVKNHEKGYYVKAIELYSNAIKKDSKFVNAIYNRGLCYLKTENKEAACSDWEKANNLGSSDAKSLIKKYCK